MKRVPRVSGCAHIPGARILAALQEIEEMKEEMKKVSP